MYDINNPPALVAQRVGAALGAIWYMAHTDSVAEVSAAGYVSNAYELGVKAGDRLIYNDTTNDVTVDLTFSAGQTKGTASGALCSAIEPVGETSIALQSAGSGTILVNDIIRFSNDDTDYRITAGDADISNGGTITITPGLVVATEVGTEIVVQDNVFTLTGDTQEFTASGAVFPGITTIELNHASVVIAATIADAKAHAGKIVVVKDTSASGTAAHTVTLTSGTWDGTNTIVTLNAPDEAIAVHFDSAGNGTIIENVGGVALS